MSLQDEFDLCRKERFKQGALAGYQQLLVVTRAFQRSLVTSFECFGVFSLLIWRRLLCTRRRRFHKASRCGLFADTHTIEHLAKLLTRTLRVDTSRAGR
jgi:hypothetical protein